MFTGLGRQGPPDLLEAAWWDGMHAHGFAFDVKGAIMWLVAAQCFAPLGALGEPLAAIPVRPSSPVAWRQPCWRHPTIDGQPLVALECDCVTSFCDFALCAQKS